MFTEYCNLINDEQLANLKSQGVDVDGNGVDEDAESSSEKIQQLTCLITILVVALVIWKLKIL